MSEPGCCDCYGRQAAAGQPQGLDGGITGWRGRQGRGRKGLPAGGGLLVAWRLTWFGAFRELPCLVASCTLRLPASLPLQLRAGLLAGPGGAGAALMGLGGLQPRVPTCLQLQLHVGTVPILPLHFII